MDGEWTVSRGHMQVRAPVQTDLRLIGLCLLIAVGFAILRPPYAFSIDDMIYVEMARAFWQEGALHIAENGGVAGAPELILKLTHGIDGRVYPQYPALYGILAAPFYGIAGVRGLVFLNAAAFFACLWLTLRIVRHLYGAALDRRWVVVVLAVGSFLPIYALGIWPHLLALAFVLAGVERACAHLAGDQKPSLTNLFIAGLWLGLAIAIRVDSLMPAVAVLVWLALLGAPSMRLAPLAMLAGMAPFLLIASALNDAKFGTFVPISYGPKGGRDGLGNYVPLILALGGALLVASLVDPSRGRLKSAIGWFTRPIAFTMSALIAVSAVIAIPPLRQVVWNTYVLVFDLQRMDASQIKGATVIGSDGFIQIVGLHKKSLAQSMPYIGLCLVTLIGFVSGRRVAARGLSWLMIGATISFYAISQWHGGYSFNMRYFLPALPFLAILSVDGFTALCVGLGGPARRTGLLIGISLGAALFAWFHFGLGSDGYTTLTLPLVLAIILALASLLVASGQRGSGLRRVWLALAGAAIMLSVVATGKDLLGQHLRVASNGPLTELTATAFPEGALVVVNTEEYFLKTRRAGVNLVSASRYEGQVARAALAAFRAERRCVYVHTQSTLEALGPEVDGDWTAVTLPGLSGLDAAFYQPEHQAEFCPLQAR